MPENKDVEHGLWWQWDCVYFTSTHKHQRLSISLEDLYCFTIHFKRIMYTKWVYVMYHTYNQSMVY